MNFKRVDVVAVMAGVVMLATGCGIKKSSDTFDGIACGESDQYRSYMNPMDSTQIQTISLDSKFTASQVAKIEKAVQTWNSHGRRTTGHDLFRTQQLTLSANSIPEASDNCGFPGTSSAFSMVQVRDSATWTSLGFTQDNPGVTLRCSGGRDFAKKQVVLINPANMTDSLFETVVLHELGHAIGMDHSCVAGSSGQANYAGCRGLASAHPYVEAVMYPYVNSGNLKVELETNDEQRASCALNYRPSSD